MKCKKCGSTIKAGEVFCSNCGYEIQIVPDYNILEDDISDALQEKKMAPTRNSYTHTQSAINSQIYQSSHEEQQKNFKRKIALIIVLSVIVVAAIILGISLFLSSKKQEQSFSYQYERAEGYYNNQLPDKAFTSIKKALELDPNNLDALLLCAKIEIELSQKEDAISTLLTVVSLYPDSTDGCSMLINLYAESGNYEEISRLSEMVDLTKVHFLFVDYIPTVPSFKQEPGTYQNELKLEIQSDSNSQIYYTLDGSSPITNGMIYNEEILLPVENGSITVKAVTTNEYGIYSEIIEGKYTIEQTNPDKPSASLPSGTYDSAQMITITVPEGCNIYYTWDGSMPNAASNKYTGPFEILEGNNILSIVAINASNRSSEVVQYNYIFYNVNSTDED